MKSELIPVFFVVLRESMEALFVVAILNACISKMPQTEVGHARWALRIGIAAGIGAAGGIAYVLMSVSELLDGDALDLFQCGMMLCAAWMMLQTAFWIGGRGGRLPIDRHDKGAATTIGVLCALAVAREGSETVIFLYGVLAVADKAVNLSALVAGILALLTSVLLFVTVQFSSRAIARSLFFRICECILFIIAGSLLMGGIDRLIAVGVVPTLTAPLWDTSRFLDESGWGGSLVSGLTGYRSRPELIVLLILGLYWSAIVGLLRLRNRRLASG